MFSMICNSIRTVIIFHPLHNYYPSKANRQTTYKFNCVPCVSWNRMANVNINTLFEEVTDVILLKKIILPKKSLTMISSKYCSLTLSTYSYVFPVFTKYPCYKLRLKRWDIQHLFNISNTLPFVYQDCYKYSSQHYNSNTSSHYVAY